MKIEDFVRKHREEFDDAEPPARAWEVVAASLPAEKNKRLWNSLNLWRVAAMFFMALSVYLLIPKGNELSRKTEALNEFRDVEKFYIQQISNKVSLIDQYQQTDGLNGFTMDFQQLEAMYMVLKEEMRLRPSEKVRDALVLNLLVRIDLLNQQLHKLEEERKVPNEGTESDDVQRAGT